MGVSPPSDWDLLEPFHCFDDYEGVLNECFVDDRLATQRKNFCISDVSHISATDTANELSLEREGETPPLKYLVEALRSSTGDSKKFQSMQKLLTDFKPHKVSKWYSDTRVGQAELYEHLERVLDAMRAEEAKAWRPYISVATLKDWSKRCLWPFQNKVSKRDVPNYYTVIKHPMHLGEMIRKLKAWQYNSKKEFAHDLLLIWENCLFFNSMPESMYHKVGLVLQAKSKQLLETIPDLSVSVVKAAADNEECDDKQFSEVASTRDVQLSGSEVAQASPSVNETPQVVMEDVIVVDGTTFHDAVEDTSNKLVEPSAEHLTRLFEPAMGSHKSAAAALFESYCLSRPQARSGQKMAEFQLRPPALPEWDSPDASYPDSLLNEFRVPTPAQPKAYEPEDLSNPALAMYITVANTAASQQLNWRIQRLMQHDWDAQSESSPCEIPHFSLPQVLFEYTNALGLRQQDVFAVLKRASTIITRHSGFGAAESATLALLPELMHVILQNTCNLFKSYVTSPYKPRLDGVRLVENLLSQMSMCADDLQAYVQRDILRYGQNLLDLRMKLETAFRIAAHRVTKNADASPSLVDLSAHTSEQECEAAYQELKECIDGNSTVGRKLLELVEERRGIRGVPHVRIRPTGQTQEKTVGYATVNLTDVPFPPILAQDVLRSEKYLQKLLSSEAGSVDSDAGGLPPKIIGLLVPYFKARHQEDDLRDDELKGRSKQQRDKRALLLKQAAYAARNKRLPAIPYGTNSSSLKGKKSKSLRAAKKTS